MQRYNVDDVPLDATLQNQLKTKYKTPAPRKGGENSNGEKSGSDVFVPEDNILKIFASRDVIVRYFIDMEGDGDNMEDQEYEIDMSIEPDFKIVQIDMVRRIIILIVIIYLNFQFYFLLKHDSTGS